MSSDDPWPRWGAFYRNWVVQSAGQFVACVLALVLVSGCAGKVDQAKFDGLYRAGKSLSGTLSVGLNIFRYRELVAVFSTEVSIAHDRAQSAKERELVQRYAEALVAFRDAESLWARTIKADPPEWLEIVGDAELKRITDAYPIAGEGSGDHFRFKTKDAVHAIWGTAQGKLSQAEQVYLGAE
jgi:hypothetical protein